MRKNLDDNSIASKPLNLKKSFQNSVDHLGNGTHLNLMGRLNCLRTKNIENHKFIVIKIITEYRPS